MEPLLSVGIIYRNEIRCLERCLKALQPLKAAIPCEIVMADTGSDDGSRQVAEQYADQVFDFPWIDDFSAARNAVMDRCTGKWYLSLDADEVLDADFGELVAFLHSPAADQAQMSYLMINNYTDPEDLKKFVPNQALRLVNLSTGARFTGKIHEKIDMPNGFAACTLAHTQLWHDGYLLQEGKKKQRNLPLIEAELAKAPDDPALLMQALESSYTKEQAQTYAERIVALIDSGSNSRPGLEPVMYRDAVKVAAVQQLPQLADWTAAALAKYPDSPYVAIDACYYAVSAALRSGDWDTVVRCGERYAKAVEVFDPAAFNTGMGAILNAAPHNAETVALALANGYAAAQRWAECQAILEAHPLKQVEPENAMLWFDLVFQHYGDMDLIAVFRQIGADFFAEDMEPTAADREKMKTFLGTCRKLIVDDPSQAPYPLMEALGDCEVAWWARVMMAKEKEDMVTPLANIHMWRAVPNIVLNRLLKSGLELPPEMIAVVYA